MAVDGSRVDDTFESGIEEESHKKTLVSRMFMILQYLLTQCRTRGILFLAALPASGIQGLRYLFTDVSPPHNINHQLKGVHNVNFDT